MCHIIICLEIAGGIGENMTNEERLKNDLLKTLQELNKKNGIGIEKWIEEDPDCLVFGKRDVLTIPEGFHWEGEVLTNKGSENSGTVVELRLVEVKKIR